MKIALIIIIAAAVVGTVFVIRSCDGENAGTDAVISGVQTESAATIGDDEADAPTGEQGRMVSVGGHRLFVRTFGNGTPVVVIEPGIGDAGGIWAPVVNAVTPHSRVMLYDRAGYGRSDVGPAPRGADRVVRELTSLLVNTPVEPPYVIVGHSLGAINALLYASEHPNLVAGLVLLDPPPLGFIKGERFPDLLAMADQMTAGFRLDAQKARESGDERQAAYFETVASEHEQMFQTGWSWVESVTSLRDMPFVVIASGVPNPEFGQSAGPFQEFWREESEALSRLSSRGRFVFVENSTHDLPGDATDEVVEAILWCIAASQDLPEYEVWQGEK
jgi:pimeloyl-ACP methyl ester carboxylesterase